MSRYLVKLYSIHPCDELSVVDLDVLNHPFYGSYGAQEGDVKCMYTMYETGVKKYGQPEDGLLYYNNSIWCIVEAEGPVSAVIIFKEKLDQDSKKT